ncbi:MAG: hypothetical protein RLZZ230_765 [Candidatus Parcubacteria bacterium]|jgi:nucleoside 2-deoxyribosyltransferase
MKFYIAGRTSRILEIRDIVTKIKYLGHEITHDWTAMEDADLPRPYHVHIDKVQAFAQKDINGAKSADVFVILGDQSGTGMYVELGAALAFGVKVYAVGEYNDMTVFHFHPNVTRLSTFDDVLKDMGL